MTLQTHDRWPPTPDATSGAKRVLVVDDDAGVRGAMSLVLEFEGFRVDTAANGAEALDKARVGHPDAIVLDMQMPVLDGRGFISAWQAEPPEHRAPVLAMSAAEGSADADAPGVHAFLPKPFDPDTLLGKLARLI